MLKNLGYDGAYNDENISVSVLLESPLEHDLDALMLTFSITVKEKSGTSTMVGIEDFTFYVMDEFNHLYNAKVSQYLKDMQEDDEPVRKPDGLIYMEFQHHFLFQDLRIAFYYRPYAKINIINLKH
ncbi:hypothetical protein EDD76_10564 [Kineothrix alysoides]|uniref:Uncharacterized protein n=1 Tax=Kineothrix alysoides TaxID=1469948 RepID=A0A4R1R0R6_9FIRM|nr:hypothetical protein [Kineothrix alysoides]TCL58894.1 hypothetical protein EDD76_10564 [Kineothrix alysoides]